MNLYWYLNYTSDGQPLDTDPSALAQWTLPPALQTKIKPGHRIVLAIWDDVGQIGRVAAFAVCISLRGNEATVTWCPSDTVLRPLAQGMHHWRNKDFFAFADSVVNRYCLDDLFAEHLGEITPVPREAPTRPTGLQPFQLRNATPGHIYVLQSPYGYKIGKTVNLTDRIRLFAVKLPFRTSLVHHFRTDDYTAAEQQLHVRYADKRLEGEWFALTPSDLDAIRAQQPK